MTDHSVLHRVLRRPLARLAASAFLALGAGLLATCQSTGGGGGTGAYGFHNAQALAQLAQEPLATKPWTFGEQPGTLIQTEHFRVFTTLEDGLYQRLLARVLEATHDRALGRIPNTRVPPPNGSLDCYVFSSRGQWEAYTRALAGSNAPIYLQISAGGYCQQGVFAGYDIGREQTLSVIAHEAWHQYSWFAFKDRLPSWLEEGLATQNEAMEWEGTRPVFKPELNFRRFDALRQAIRGNYLWKISDLASTHAGRVIKLPQKNVDAYYAQLWSLVLFLERSPEYRPKLQSLLADASAGRLTQALDGTGVSRREIDNFSERWNAVAGPVYLNKYINPSTGELEQQYDAYIRRLTASWPPKADAVH